MASINVYNARATFFHLVERALAGEDIVITRRGRPAVRLVPVAQERGRLEADELFEPLPEGLLDPCQHAPFLSEDEEPPERGA